MNRLVYVGLVAVAALAVACSGNRNGKGADSSQSDSAVIADMAVTQPQLAEVKDGPVEIVDTCMLRIYYPKYSRIDLVCGEMPKKSNDSVILVCAAAYTVKCLDHFNHENIIGNHVSGGKLYKGTSSDTYRGAFTFYDGKPHFAYNNWNVDFHMASTKDGCGFAQDMMLHKGGIVKHWRDDGSKALFRALCLIDGKVAVADAKEVVTFRDFIQNLINAGGTEAIYLDMGGWKHSWLRDAEGKTIDIFPNPNKYATNWITFYK